MNKSLILFIQLLLPCLLYGQIEDCVGAYPVCGNSPISLIPTGVGANDFDNPNNVFPSCFVSEQKTIWMKFKIKQAGSLGFTIVPKVLTGVNREDYDFALFGPNKSCNNLGTAIRCSTTNPQQANVSAYTGLSEDATDFSEGPGADGDGFVHWLDNTQVGEIYYLFIDNFSQQDGYTIEWTGTALLEDRLTKADGGVDLGPDLDLCEGTSFTLDATIPGGKYYTWTNENGQTISTNNTLLIDEGGTYFVDVVSETGCFSKDSIVITKRKNPVLTSISAIPNNLCEIIPSIQLSAEGDINETYEWFNPNGVSIGFGKQITISNVSSQESGNYKVRLSNIYDCYDEKTIYVDAFPTFYFEEDIKKCPGEKFIIPQTGEEIIQEDTIQVNLLSKKGCDSIYVYNIRDLSCGDVSCVGIPNSFAPNNNNENETFMPLFAPNCNPDTYDLKIYNRWGEEVTSLKDSTIGWDGTQKGLPSLPGIYLWKLTYIFPDDEEISYLGTIYLIR